jgi:hypothetical protein
MRGALKVTFIDERWSILRSTPSGDRQILSRT